MNATAALRSFDAKPVRTPSNVSAPSATVTPLGVPKRLRQKVRRGETLYAAGDTFRVLYVVRVGVMKSFTVSNDGLMQVTGFHLAGDVLGFDGIDSGMHQSSIVALDDCEVFVVPFGQCERWSLESPHAQRLMMRALSREILRSQELMLVLGTMSAEQRVATFLLDISERYAQRGYSRSAFILRMTRQDIGSYLGLKLETVSRIFSRFQAEGALQVQGKSLSVLDFAALWRTSGLSPDRHWPSADSILDRDGELRVA